MAATKPLPLRNEQARLRRFTRAHSPLQPPKFNRWHGLTMLILGLLLWGQQNVPGVMADWSGLIVGNWQAGILARVTVIALLAYALLFVRTAHILAYLGMLLAAAGICFRLGDIRITHEPLTLGFALSLLGIALVAVRIITRLPDPEPATETGAA